MNLYLTQALAKWKEQKRRMLPLWNGRNYIYSRLGICKVATIVSARTIYGGTYAFLKTFFLHITLRQAL